MASFHGIFLDPLFSQLCQPLSQCGRIDVRNADPSANIQKVQKHPCLSSVCHYSIPFYIWFFWDVDQTLCLPKGFESGRRRAGVRSFEPLRRLSEVDFAIHQTARLWAWFAEMSQKCGARKMPKNHSWHVRTRVVSCCFPGTTTSPISTDHVVHFSAFWRCETRRLCLAKFPIRSKTRKDILTI